VACCNHRTNSFDSVGMNERGTELAELGIVSLPKGEKNGEY
jgi:hypothetical protein